MESTVQPWLLTVWSKALISYCFCCRLFFNVFVFASHTLTFCPAVTCCAHTGRVVNVRNSGLQGFRCGTAERERERERHEPSVMTRSCRILCMDHRGARPSSFHEVCVDSKKPQTTWCMLFCMFFLLASLFSFFCFHSCAFSNPTWLLLHHAEDSSRWPISWLTHRHWLTRTKFVLCLDSLPFGDRYISALWCYCFENIPIMFSFHFSLSLSLSLSLSYLSPICNLIIFILTRLQWFFLPVHSLSLICKTAVSCYHCSHTSAIIVFVFFFFFIERAKEIKENRKERETRWNFWEYYLPNDFTSHQANPHIRQQHIVRATCCCSNNTSLVNVWICLMIMISQQEPSLRLHICLGLEQPLNFCRYKHCWCY